MKLKNEIDDILFTISLFLPYFTFWKSRIKTIIESKNKSDVHRTISTICTQKEASETLEMPIGTIKTRNRNCISELRKALDV